eukprot:31484-Pelagococcus_subviridis.AAC.5
MSSTACASFYSYTDRSNGSLATLHSRRRRSAVSVRDLNLQQRLHGRATHRTLVRLMPQLPRAPAAHAHVPTRQHRRVSRFRQTHHALLPFVAAAAAAAAHRVPGRAVLDTEDLLQLVALPVHADLLLRRDDAPAPVVSLPELAKRRLMLHPRRLRAAGRADRRRPDVLHRARAAGDALEPYDDRVRPVRVIRRELRERVRRHVHGERRLVGLAAGRRATERAPGEKVQSSLRNGVHNANAVVRGPV